MSHSRTRRAEKRRAREIIDRVRLGRGETLASVADAIGMSTAALSKKLNEGYGERLSEAEIDRLVAHLDLIKRDRDLLRQCFGYQEPPTNLPAMVSSFVGRATEQAALRRSILQHRLVTVTGEAGSGKTRLALEVALGLREHFAYGVWLVELAALAEPRRIVPAVAAALRVRERSGQPLDDLVTEHLRPRMLLLVLDNCEHLVTACAGVVETLLRASPALRVVSTSRQSLRIAGEQIYRVPPLTYPAAGDGGRSPAAAGRFDAISLFVARATERLGQFDLTEASVATVGEICRRLDGNPLALELAAARLDTTAVEEMPGALERRFSLLTAGSRTAPARHQTLHRAIAWSHDLLSMPEQVVFRRLAVFAGGFTVEDAGTVCHGDGLDVAGVIAALAEQSLVRPAGSPGGVRRLVMLESIHAFAEVELLASGEADAIRRRHLDAMVERSETCAREFRRSHDVRHLARIEAEIDNLHAAVRSAIAVGDVEAGARLVYATHDIAGAQLTYATSDFAWRAGQQSEHLTWADALLALPQAATHSWARARLLVMDVSAFTGEAAATQYRPRMEAAIAICRELNDRPLLAEALRLLAWHLYMDGELASARVLADESIALTRAHGDDLLLIHALNLRGLIALVEDDRDAVYQHATEGRARAERAGNLPLLGHHIRFFAELAARRGDYAEAHALYQRVYDLHLTGGRSPRLGQTLCQWGCISLDQHRLDEAGSRLSESVALSRDAGPLAFLLGALDATADLAERSGRPVEAARIFASVEATSRALHVRRCQCDRPRREAALARIRARLDPATFDDAWADGTRMDREAAVAMALSLAARPSAIAIG